MVDYDLARLGDVAEFLGQMPALHGPMRGGLSGKYSTQTHTAGTAYPLLPDVTSLDCRGVTTRSSQSRTSDFVR